MYDLSLASEVPMEPFQMEAHSRTRNGLICLPAFSRNGIHGLAVLLRG